MNHKRKKPRRQVRCTLCTQLRWLGNSAKNDGRKRIGERAAMQKELQQ